MSEIKYKYIGPEYKTSLVVNGRAISPRNIPQKMIPRMLSQYPDLKKMFKAEGIVANPSGDEEAPGLGSEEIDEIKKTAKGKTKN